MRSRRSGRLSSIVLSTNTETRKHIPAPKTGQSLSTAASPNRLIWLVVSILLIGAALRIALLTDNRFHPDEALFAALGRLIANGQDPWLSHTTLLVDKPPLFYYLLAAGISMSWASELTARLPGLFASLIGMALLARLARTLWGSDWAALLALIVYALSPFAILFAPTAFADPQFVMWVLASLCAVVAGRWGWAGLLYGLGLATKQSALFFAVLIVGMGIIHRAESREARPGTWGRLLRFAVAAVIPVLLATAWDVGRTGATGYWSAGVAFNNPGRLARSNEVWTRALALLSWGRYVGGTALVSGALAVILLVFVLFEWDNAKHGLPGAPAALLLAGFLVAYAAVHWLVAFPILDRYLLPVVPLGALLVGRGVVEAARRLRNQFSAALPWFEGAAALFLFGMLAMPALSAVKNAYPVGGDHGAFDGIDQIADELGGFPEGTVVYYQSLGWSLHYYLFDAPVYLAPIDGPGALRSDLTTFGHSGGDRRYLVLASWDSDKEILGAVEEAGFCARLETVTANRYGQRSFALYQILDPHYGSCDSS
jgi:4-amino-4-deoxy-L-arabinose transferase-like glycosyltransferase